MMKKPQNSDYLSINFRPNVILRKMKSGENYYVKINRSGYHQYLECEFIGIEAGRVKGKIIGAYIPTGHGLFHGIKIGDEYKSMAKTCFLWGKNDTDPWDRVHWFKGLDIPLT